MFSCCYAGAMVCLASCNLMLHKPVTSTMITAIPWLPRVCDMITVSHSVWTIILGVLSVIWCGHTLAYCLVVIIGPCGSPLERGHPVAVRHLILWSQPALRLFAHARPHLDGGMVSQLLRFAHVLLTIPRGILVSSSQTYSTFNFKNPRGELTTPVQTQRCMAGCDQSSKLYPRNSPIPLLITKQQQQKGKKVKPALEADVETGVI